MSEVFSLQTQIDDQRKKVELSSRYIDQICEDTVYKYTKDLDALIKSVSEVLKNNDDTTITNQEYESLAIKLPTYLYEIVSVQERLGIRADVSKAFEKEKFSNIAMSVQGTAKEREYYATTETQADSVVSIACARAYKTLQLKVQVALELLASIKKIMSRRLETANLPE